jgi:hypothetical protein
MKSITPINSISSSLIPVDLYMSLPTSGCDIRTVKEIRPQTSSGWRCPHGPFVQLSASRQFSPQSAWISGQIGMISRAWTATGLRGGGGAGDCTTRVIFVSTDTSTHFPLVWPDLKPLMYSDSMRTAWCVTTPAPLPPHLSHAQREEDLR